VENKMESRLKKFWVSLPAEEVNWLDAVAQAQRCSRNALIRAWLHDYYEALHLKRKAFVVGDASQLIQRGDMQQLQQFFQQLFEGKEGEFFLRQMQNLMRGMAQLFAVAAERYGLDVLPDFLEGLVKLTSDEEEMEKLVREVAGGESGCT
jgi:hypothetical protein